MEAPSWGRPGTDLQARYGPAVLLAWRKPSALLCISSPHLRPLTVARVPHSIDTLPSSVGAGYIIWAIPELTGHSSASPTMICAHALDHGGRGVRGLVDVS